MLIKSPNSARFFHSNCHSWRCILLQAPDDSRLPALHPEDLRHLGRTARWKGRSGSHPQPQLPRNPHPQRPSIPHARSPRSGARTFSPLARYGRAVRTKTAHSDLADVAQSGFRPDAPPTPIAAGKVLWPRPSTTKPRPDQSWRVGFCGPALCAKPRPQPSARCSRPRNCGCGSERVRGLLGLSELEG